LEAIKPINEDDYFIQCLQKSEDGKLDIFIAEFTGQDVGYVLYNREPKYSLYQKLEVPEIQDLNVLPEFRKNGVGTALINHCEETAKEEGRKHVGISVGLYPGYGPAQRLYAKLGYIPDGNGIAYDRENLKYGETRPLDDDLCLMMLKDI
jgi:GNAT superfamily N-acetyltransferase